MQGSPCVLRAFVLQVYAMPVYDMIEYQIITLSKGKIPNGFITRLVYRTIYIVLVAFIAMTLPFFGGTLWPDLSCPAVTPWPFLTLTFPALTGMALPIPALPCHRVPLPSLQISGQLPCLPCLGYPALPLLLLGFTLPSPLLPLRCHVTQLSQPYTAPSCLTLLKIHVPTALPCSCIWCSNIAVALQTCWASLAPLDLGPQPIAFPPCSGWLSRSLAPCNGTSGLPGFVSQLALLSPCWEPLGA